MKFFIATKNQKKLNELKRILTPLGITAICESDLNISIPEPEETGVTFEENAYIKAECGMKATGLPTIADDSGLCVDALGGAPGVYSARYAGEPTDNLKNNLKLLREMENVPEEERTARFISSVACVFPNGKGFSVDGKCEGKIAFQMTGNNGFGYDVLFVSELGCFGEISDELKDSISHRGRALEALSVKLKEFLKEENIC